jgi:hypothetical protein
MTRHQGRHHAVRKLGTERLSPQGSCMAVKSMMWRLGFHTREARRILRHHIGRGPIAVQSRLSAEMTAQCEHELAAYSASTVSRCTTANSGVLMQSDERGLINCTYFASREPCSNYPSCQTSRWAMGLQCHPVTPGQAVATKKLDLFRLCICPLLSSGDLETGY